MDMSALKFFWSHKLAIITICDQMILSPLHPSLTCLEGTRALWTGSTASPFTAMLATQPGHRIILQMLPAQVHKISVLTLEAVHRGYLDGKLSVPGCVHAAWN